MPTGVHELRAEMNAARYRLPTKVSSPTPPEFPEFQTTNERKTP